MKGYASNVMTLTQLPKKVSFCWNMLLLLLHLKN